LLCSPFWSEERAGLDAQAAFVQLVEEPLLQKVDAGEFQAGDQVEGYRSFDLKIGFRRLEEGEQ
jgi:hypothetical protein